MGRRDERRGVRDDRAELNALRHRLDNALDVTAEEELVDVLQRHRQADRHDHLLHDAHALVPQRCPDELVLHPSGERAVATAKMAESTTGICSICVPT